jgi:hemoglobin
MTSAQHSLDKRLGGYDVIAAVIDDMFTAMRRRPRVCAVRRGTQPRLTHPLPAAPGRPDVPTQRRSVRVHRTRHEDAGLGITAAEWTGSMVHAATALVRHDVADPERAEFLGLFERYRDEIVEGG